MPWQAIREATGADGDPVQFQFRGRAVRGLASITACAAARQNGPYPRPITDLVNLELVLLTDSHPSVAGSPAELSVAVEAFRTASIAIHHASRWASYCTRVAVVAPGSLRSRDALEAQCRGIWVLDSEGQVLVNGHVGRWPDSRSGILHRLLAEYLWAQLAPRSGDGILRRSPVPQGSRYA